MSALWKGREEERTSWRQFLFSRNTRENYNLSQWGPHEGSRLGVGFLSLDLFASCFSFVSQAHIYKHTLPLIQHFGNPCRSSSLLLFWQSYQSTGVIIIGHLKLHNISFKVTHIGLYRRYYVMTLPYASECRTRKQIKCRLLDVIHCF